MVNLIIADGEADWAGMEGPIKEKYSWISFLHCVLHIGSLVMSDIGKIPQVANLVNTVIDI